MKTVDLYTKSVLTIIAIALVVIAFKSLDVVPEVKAAQVPSPAGVVDVNIVSVKGNSISTSRMYGSEMIDVKCYQ